MTMPPRFENGVFRHLDCRTELVKPSRHFNLIEFSLAKLSESQ